MRFTTVMIDIIILSIPFVNIPSVFVEEEVFYNVNVCKVISVCKILFGKTKYFCLQTQKQNVDDSSTCNCVIQNAIICVNPLLIKVITVDLYGLTLIGKCFFFSVFLSLCRKFVLSPSVSTCEHFLKDYICSVIVNVRIKLLTLRLCGCVWDFANDRLYFLHHATSAARQVGMAPLNAGATLLLLN